MDAAQTRAVETGVCELVELILTATPTASSNLFNECIETACKAGHLVIVQHLIDTAASKGISLNLDEALSVACQGGSVPVVSAIIKAGADVNNSTFGQVPLVTSLEMYPAVVDELLASGALIDRIPDNMRGQAMGCGSMLLLQRILTVGGCTDTEFGDALVAAAERGHTAIIHALLAASAQSVPDLDFPITMALTKGHTEAAEVLIDALPMGTSISDHVSSAAEGGCVEVVKAMLTKGIDLDRLNGALNQTVNPTIVRLLLDANAGIDDIYGNSVLYVSCLKHQPAPLRLLLEAGAQVNEHAAELLKAILLDKREDPDVTTRNDNAADQAAVMRLLFDAGVCIDAAFTHDELLDECNNNTVATMAALVPVLLEHDPSLLAARHSQSGMTLISMAVESGNVTLVKLLIDAGADLTVRVGDNQHLIVVAIKAMSVGPTTRFSEQCIRNQWSILQLLLSAGVDPTEGDGAAMIALMDGIVHDDDMSASYIRDIAGAILERPASKSVVDTDPKKAAALPEESNIDARAARAARRARK